MSGHFANETIETLARWSNILNNWDWPEDLPGKPEGFDDWTRALGSDQQWEPNKYEYTNPYMYAIRLLIGHKEELRWHWLYTLNRTNEEFEEWYRGQP